MDQTFYGTIAQVIPVFLLTGIVELRFFERLRTVKPTPKGAWRLAARMSPRSFHRMSVIIVGLVFLLSVLGTIAAIAATQSEDVPGYDHTFAVVGLATSCAFVVVPVLDNLQRIWNSDPQEGDGR